MHRITVLPQQVNIEAAEGQRLLDVLRRAGYAISAPCGGSGTCGKCKVTVNGEEVSACRTVVDRDMTVLLPWEENAVILTEGTKASLPASHGLCLAVDIGTTTVAAYLIENGQVLATQSRKSPQAAYGADVVSRIACARKGEAAALTTAIRDCLAEITDTLFLQTGKTGPDSVCIVGNPAMQQLFLGLSVDNLATPPFTPMLTKAQCTDAGAYIPAWTGAKLLTVPNIGGYIGADTVAGILATEMDKTDKLTLLVDIGTNGEMVLGNRHRLVACATAAGPALEGAGILFGMQAADGAIDRVDREGVCHTIGEAEPMGICGSGLIDAVAVALHREQLNQRGRILNEEHTLPLSGSIHLTQEDIRQLQQAKGAIAAGIRLMAQYLNVALKDIEAVYLAGAFGTFLDPHSACRIGLIPPELEDKLQPIGNAAGSGAMQIVCSEQAFARTDTIVSQVEQLELAALPGWAKCFAESMRFDADVEYFCKRALSLGFSQAVSMDPGKLVAREDVRAMCAADKCGAYGKNHTCPPHCGTLAECAARMTQYSRGILLQTVGTTEKAIDTKAYRRVEQQHLQQFYQLAELIRKSHRDALCLGAGGCRICKTCAFPDPCRFPEKACASMEAYGLFVTEVCRDNGLPYHHGERTVTYTACVLF